MNPNDPFEPKPLPDAGAATQREVFEAVGAALSAWEHSELHMALVFSHLVGDGAHSEAAYRAYGSAIAFTARAAMVEAASERALLEHPERDELAPKLKKAVELMRKASARRNEIAHGAVFAYCVLASRPDATGYCLFPGQYSRTKRFVTGEPKYVYSAQQIDAYRAAFESLAEPVLAVMMQLVSRRGWLDRTQKMEGQIKDAGLAPMHPGELLRETVVPSLEDSGEPREGLPGRFGMTPMEFDDLLAERRPIDPVAARGLAQGLGTSPDFWLNLQRTHDKGRKPPRS
jgi:plasmid maintenance system antidote protein VapI